jgi:hypothetical protein
MVLGLFSGHFLDRIVTVHHEIQYDQRYFVSGLDVHGQSPSSGDGDKYLIVYCRYSLISQISCGLLVVNQQNGLGSK